MRVISGSSAFTFSDCRTLLLLVFLLFHFLLFWFEKLSVCCFRLTVYLSFSRLVCAGVSLRMYVCTLLFRLSTDRSIQEMLPSLTFYFLTFEFGSGLKSWSITSSIRIWVYVFGALLCFLMCVWANILIRCSKVVEVNCSSSK